jgi:hypothetical protein
MPGKPVRIPVDILERLDEAAELENAERRRAGLAPITRHELMRDLLARFVGLPMLHDFDLGAIRARLGLPAEMWTPPHGGTTTKARAKKKASLTMEDPPHGGTTTKRVKKPRTPEGGKPADFSWTPPHGGTTTK